MKKRLGLILVILLACALEGSAQQGAPTPVQQAPSRLDAAAQVATSASTGGVLTLTPNGGEYVYIYEMDVQNCAGASAVSAAAPTTLVTAGLTGSPIWTIGSGVTAGACAQNFSVSWPTGLKATASGAVTFTLPAFATNQTVRVNVAWRSAPIQ